MPAGSHSAAPTSRLSGRPRDAPRPKNSLDKAVCNQVVQLCAQGSRAVVVVHIDAADPHRDVVICPPGNVICLILHRKGGIWLDWLTSHMEQEATHPAGQQAAHSNGAQQAEVVRVSVGAEGHLIAAASCLRWRHTML